MIVKASRNKKVDIPLDIRNYAFGGDGKQIPLTVGKRYVVSGIREMLGHEFFLIIPDDNELSGRPWWYPSELFEVTDDFKPEDWVKNDFPEVIYETFPELANDATGNFENNLEDGEQQEMSVFLSYYEKYARHHGLWYVDGKPAD